MKGRGAADRAGTAVGAGPKLEKPVDCCWNCTAGGGGVAKASKPEKEELLLLLAPPPPPAPEGVPKASNEAPLFTGSLPNASKV